MLEGTLEGRGVERVLLLKRGSSMLEGIRGERKQEKQEKQAGLGYCISAAFSGYASSSVYYGIDIGISKDGIFPVEQKQ